MQNKTKKHSDGQRQMSEWLKLEREIKGEKP